MARQQGFEPLPIIALPHPLGGRDPAELAPAIAAGAEQVGAALLQPPVLPAASEATPREWEAPADPWEFLRFAGEHGWGDGLPLLPPTETRVAACLAAAGCPPDRVLGRIPPSDNEADARSVAANAAMSGCEPAYLPVVLAAVRALLDPAVNLRALQTTTHPVTPLLIVHGPVVNALAFNAGPNVLGQGNRANAAVGRAVRLVLQNIGGARPGSTDRGTHGAPTKYSYCMAEQADAVAWSPLHAARGLDPGASAVTVLGAEPPHNVNDHGSAEPAGLLTTIAGTLATLGSNNLYLRGPMLLVLSPEHAALFAGAGWSREDVTAALCERATVDVSAVSAGNLERYARITPALFDPPPTDGVVPILDRPEDLLVVVAGGPGKHSLVIPSFGSTEAVTVPLDGGGPAG